MTVTVFGYLILISIDFYDFISPVVSLVLISIEKIYHTFKTVFDHISKHLELEIFKNTLFLLDVWNCGI